MTQDRTSPENLSAGTTTSELESSQGGHLNVRREALHLSSSWAPFSNQHVISRTTDFSTCHQVAVVTNLLSGTSEIQISVCEFVCEYFL